MIHQKKAHFIMTLTKQLTRSEERMRSDFDWLNSRHSFSFGVLYQRW